MSTPTKAPPPTAAEAVAAHVLRAIGSKDCRRSRPALKDGKRYPFAFHLSGTFAGEEISRHHEGDLVVGHPTTEQAAPSARDLVAALLSLYETPAARTRLLNRLAAVDLDALPDALRTDAAEYTIYEVDPNDEDDRTAVTGHEGVALTVADVILDTPGSWGKDSTGYNFAHEIDVSTNPAFPKAGVDYLVEVRVTTTGEQPRTAVWRLRCI